MTISLLADILSVAFCGFFFFAMIVILLTKIFIKEPVFHEDTVKAKLKEIGTNLDFVCLVLEETPEGKYVIKKHLGKEEEESQEEASEQ